MTRGEATGPLVRFRVAGVDYAIDVRSVREVVAPLPCVAMPGAPPGVSGVAEYRGDVVPVVDARARFGASSAPPPQRPQWLVVDVGSHDVALVADAVLDVFVAAQRGSGEDTPRGIAAPRAADVVAIAHHREGIVFVLDTAPIEALTAPVAVSRRRR